MTIKELLIEGTQKLKESNISDANLKSKLLIMHLLKIPKEYLIIHSQEKANLDLNEFNLRIEQLKAGKPLEYITHQKEFMKLNFYVDENVLIPRADTEIVVEEVLRRASEKDKILDLCTGSGAIAVALAKYLKNFFIFASDISSEALKIAQKNAEQNDTKIQLIHSNLFEAIDMQFDIIVSNPPYIETTEIAKLDKEVQKEPILALDGGEDGLFFYRKIAEDAKKHLKPGGNLILEIGYHQKQTVSEILQNAGYCEIECIQDLSGNDRVMLAKLNT